MTTEERQRIVDLVGLGVERYFNHYLTDVSPEQMDRVFKDHNSDVDAHPVQFKVVEKTERKVARFVWMIMGMSALVSFAVLVGTLVDRWTPFLS